MPPVYDLILENNGRLQVEQIAAVDENAAWRMGFMLHLHTLRAVVQIDSDSGESKPES